VILLIYTLRLLVGLVGFCVSDCFCIYCYFFWIWYPIPVKATRNSHSISQKEKPITKTIIQNPLQYICWYLYIVLAQKSINSNIFLSKTYPLFLFFLCYILLNNSITHFFIINSLYIKNNKNYIYIYQYRWKMSMLWHEQKFITYILLKNSTDYFNYIKNCFIYINIKNWKT